MLNTLSRIKCSLIYDTNRGPDYFCTMLMLHTILASECATYFANCVMSCAFKSLHWPWKSSTGLETKVLGLVLEGKVLDLKSQVLALPVKSLVLRVSSWPWESITGLDGKVLGHHWQHDTVSAETRW